MNIDIGQAQSGMSLNRDVTDPQGQVLLRSGAALTERHLDLIRAHGIERIDVCSEIPAANGTRPAPAPPPEQLFRNLDLQHPLVRELLRLCAIRQAQTTETPA